MRTRLGHRKLVRHEGASGEAHELTFSCYRRLQLLRLNSRCELLAESIDRAMETQRYELIAYVFMPEHVHLLVLPLDGARGVARLLFVIKRPFSYRVKMRMAAEGDPRLSELTIRDRPNHASFRFWQEGAGYDRNIRKESTLRAAIDDIHRNPVRRGWVDETGKWKWSLLACVRRGDGECTDAAQGGRVELRSRRGLSTGGQATSGARVRRIM